MIVCAGHDPFPDYPDRVRDVLDAACSGLMRFANHRTRTQELSWNSTICVCW
jgi:hypothetical protein